jgi:hypothetical protein
MRLADDDETLAERARRGTFYVPTIDHNGDVVVVDQRAGAVDGSLRRPAARS